MFKRTILYLVSAITLLTSATYTYAWEGMAMPRLRVDGRHLKDENGNIVKLHGYAQTFSPWFNERGTRWNNYDVEGCLRYNKGIIDRIMAAGWKMSFVRMHMDPYWSNTPGRGVKGENDISAFDFGRFEKYLDEIFVPMAEYAIEKGMYVVMRPPGVCPEKIAVGDGYQKYLLKVWRHVAQHTTLKNHPNIMFELANEPINILGSDGTFGGGSKAHFEQLSKYFQEITDTIRAQGCDNILWIPGLGYQSKYAGYADYPIKGENIGYAVHIYPGWFGSGHGYEAFSKGWEEDVQPVSSFAPVMITEMDWADKKWNASWGKALTGTAGDQNFGANFKKITDDAENVSWLLFTSPEHLADFKDVPAKEGEYTFLTDPEACPWPIYHWYLEYAKNHYPRKSFTHGPTANDNFRHYDLSKQWEWNINGKSKWSLTERPGHLRLYTAGITDNLHHAQGTSIQRTIDQSSRDGLSYRTIAIDISNMQDGDVAGVALMEDTTTYIAVRQKGKRRYITHSTIPPANTSKEERNGKRIKANTVYLRAITGNSSGKRQFYYSTDNIEYIHVGEEIETKSFTGNKFAIFNYATKRVGGWVDIDWFTTEPEFSEEVYYDNYFKSYSEESLTLEKLEFAIPTTLLTGSTRGMELKATYKDGHSEDVSTLATYSGYDKKTIAIDNGRITAIKDGTTAITATYKGPRGKEIQSHITVTSTTFPMTKGEFNPSIWDKGTFDEKSRTFTTGKYGFAGWRYANGLDISKYKYLTVDVSGAEKGSLSLRLFDENNYWSDCAIYNFNGKSRITIATDSIKRSKNKDKDFATEHIYILGFWSTGGVPFRIEKIELSNTTE